MSVERARFTFNDNAQASPQVVSALLKVDAWASSVQSRSVSVGMNSWPGSTTCDIIEQFARAFINDATGIEKVLLLKSLQEALLYGVDLDTDLTADEITSRLKEFVNSRGKAAFIEQFLSIYFFNYLWLDESRRPQIPAVEEFEYSMQVERMCRRAVIAALAPEDVMDRSSAQTLLLDILEGLRGLMKLAR
jgi:hypothetical protein